MDELNELILSPFKELVDRGKETVENAEGSEDMAKAGKNLAREGERAVSRLEPVCTNKFNEYQPAFVASLKSNSECHLHPVENSPLLTRSVAELLDLREELIALLWGFEDYTEPDGFEVDKFKELSACARKTALKMYDGMIRTKLEAPTKPDSLGLQHPSDLRSPISPPTSPSLINTHLSPQNGSFPPLPYAAFDDSRSRSLLPGSQSNNNNMDSLYADYSRRMTNGSGSSELPRLSVSTLASVELAGSETDRGSLTTDPSRNSMPFPPPPPSTNPWDLRKSPTPQEGVDKEDDQYFERRAAVGGGDESPIDPMSPLLPRPGDPNFPPPPNTQLPPTPITFSPIDTDSPGHASGKAQASYSIFPQTRKPVATSIVTSTILEDHVTTEYPPRNPSERDPVSPYVNTMSPELRGNRPISQPSPIDMGTSSFENRLSTPPNLIKDRPFSANDIVQQQAYPPPAQEQPGQQQHQAGLETVRAPGDGLEMANTLQSMDHGLIPVESEQPDYDPMKDVRSRYHPISHDSSFYQLKGFCTGAREALRGGNALKKTRKPVSFCDYHFLP